MPLGSSSGAEEELNGFLACHKVLNIERQFYQNGAGGVWTFCVSYIGGVPESSRGGRKPDLGLNELQQAVFERMRQIRKQIAKEDGTAPYNVFTDVELAAVCRLEEYTPKALLTVKGIGKGKIDRYGKKLLERYLANPVEAGAAGGSAAPAAAPAAADAEPFALADSPVEAVPAAGEAGGTAEPIAPADIPAADAAPEATAAGTESSLFAGEMEDLPGA